MNQMETARPFKYFSWIIFFLLFFPQEMLEYFHSNYLRKWLIRDSNSFVHDEDILLAYRRLAYK